METLARMFVSAVDLVEAEGRLLRRQAIRTALTIVMVLCIGAFLLLGLCFLLWGVYGYVSLAVGREAAALIVGGVWIAAAGATYVCVWRRSR